MSQKIYAYHFAQMVQDRYLRANISLCIDRTMDKIDRRCMFIKDKCLHHPSSNLGVHLVIIKHLQVSITKIQNLNSWQSLKISSTVVQTVSTCDCFQGIQGTVTDTCFPFVGMNASVWSTDSLALQAFQVLRCNCAIISSQIKGADVQDQCTDEYDAD